VVIEMRNYTEQKGAVTLYDISPDSAEDATIKPDFSTQMDQEVTKVWQVPIEPGSVWRVEYSGTGGGSRDIRGIDQKYVVTVDLDV
jgi:DNA topoisomerase-6 subunit B